VDHNHHHQVNHVDSMLRSLSVFSSSLRSLDLWGIQCTSTMLVELTHLPLSLTKLHLFLSGIQIPSLWKEFFQYHHQLESVGIRGQVLPSWLLSMLVSSLSSSLHELVFFEHGLTSACFSSFIWISFFQIPSIQSSLRRLTVHYINDNPVLYDLIARSSLSYFSIPTYFVSPDCLHRLSQSRNLLTIPGLTTTQNEGALFFRCIQNQVQLDAWKRVCFLVAWMRANADNPIQDSGLDWVRSMYWNTSSNVLSQFMQDFDSG
jgi:hypothetical protein